MESLKNRFLHLDTLFLRSTGITMADTRSSTQILQRPYRSVPCRAAIIKRIGLRERHETRARPRYRSRYTFALRRRRLVLLSYFPDVDLIVFSLLAVPLSHRRLHRRVQQLPRFMIPGNRVRASIEPKIGIILLEHAEASDYLSGYGIVAGNGVRALTLYRAEFPRSREIPCTREY